MTIVEGFARCVNQQCGHYEVQDGTEVLVTMFDVDRPIPVEIEVCQIKGTNASGDVFSNVVLQETEYHHAVHDEDAVCPECAQPCAVIPGAKITVPVKYGSYAGR